MNEWLDDLRIAVAMLTRIPMPHPDGPSPANFARAQRLLPLVGAGIGAAVGLVYWALGALGLPVLAAAGLALGAGMWLTGGFHEDGLADVADGFGGGRDRDAKLEIMRDSRIGTYGTLAVIVAFTAKLAALASLSATTALAALIAAHALSRAALPPMKMFLPAARTDGLAASAGDSDSTVATIAIAIGVVVTLAALPFTVAVPAILIALVAVAAVAWLAQRQIGGYTGDVLGAAQQAAEVAVLLLVATRLGAPA
jgi:adenosylcobinamide-GDP ribazoletransferase